MSRLASDLGVTMPTIKRWISILEMSYVIFLLPPYFRNFGKRVIKRPKIYFYDTGLVSALTGIRTEEMYDRGPMAGALFENYILSQVLKHHKHTNRRSEFYFYRTSHGVEIDLVIDTGQTRHFVEIKKTSTFRPRLTKTLNTLASQADTATLVYQGESLPDYGNVRICNWSNYLTHKKE